MENIKISSIDNYQLSLNIYNVENPKGYIQILHGMQEHQNRYKDLALYLNKHGYTVITSDMRSHGENAVELGYFKEKDGYKFLLEDQKVITKYIKEKFNTNKVIILAHSMGTIIARNLLQTESNDYEKMILSGYPNYQVAVKGGILIGKFIRMIKGGKYQSNLLHNLSVGSFNKKIKNPKTNLDWLSVNEENVNKYLEDPLCGFPFKTSAFIDLFTLLSKMNNYKNTNVVNNVPLLLIAGKEDPCVGGKKGKENSIKALNKAHFTKIVDIDYSDMRHEIFNETNNIKVYEDIVSFLGGDTVE